MAPSVRLLLVSVETPPSNNAEAFQVGKVLTELRRRPELIVDVMTALPPPGASANLTTLLDADPLATYPSQVVHLPCRLNRCQRIALRLVVPWLADQPDWWFRFTWQAQLAVRRLRHKPDVIYSRAFPPSSNLLALKLARHYQVPWFLHLSDPWCESSLELHWNRSQWHRRTESRCFHAATRISFTSSFTLQRYMKRYPKLADRMVIDPNVYASTSMNAAPWSPGHRFRVVHTGSFTKERPVDTLLEALATLPAHHPLFTDLELLQAGHSTAHSKSLIVRAGPWMQDLGLLNPSEALDLQLQADLLLAIDWRFQSALDAQFLLSKLTDYLALRRPVLLISHPEGVSARFVAAHNLGQAVSHDDPAGIAAALVDYWQAWKQREHSRFELPPPTPLYSAPWVARSVAVAAQNALHFSPSSAL